MQCLNFGFLHGWTAQLFLGFVIVKVSNSPSDAPHVVGLLWKSDRSNAQTSHNTHKREISMSPAGFKPATLLSEWSQTPPLRPRGHRDRNLNFSTVGHRLCLP